MKILLYIIVLLLLSTITLAVTKTEEAAATLCITLHKPVCADGITYQNSCFAEAAGHSSWAEGSCEKEISPIWVIIAAIITIVIMGRLKRTWVSLR